MRSEVFIAISLSALAFASCKADGQKVTDLIEAGQSAQTTVEAAPIVQTVINFDDTLTNLTAKIDAEIEQPIVVPVPKDAGGGYTHEQHKFNAKSIYEAASLYEFTGEKKYADYATQLFEDYAAQYPSWGLHPEQKEQSPGRMFWQNLNESWWLVYTSQGYDKIKDTLSDEQRDNIETNVLRAIAEFLSEGSPETFNKIHNHGTWATTAVALTGYAIGDEDYVEKALMGLDKSGDYGFLKQLDNLFSPDGYYNEGPYYQRYALMPFVLFGQAIEKNDPDRKIFEYRDGILKKAIDSTIQQNYGGLFFPINDAIKDKGIATQELQYGVSIAYELTGDNGLLAIAEAQGEVVPTPGGRKLATAIAAGKTEPFNYKTMRLRDGRDGTEGALDIIRASTDPDDLTLVVKNTSQGLGHGHFDKLGILLYDAGHEILRDYGAARFLNVEAKYGGHYLRENNTFAKQTIAHNALVVDEVSHFNGDVNIGNKNAPELGTFVNTPEIKATAAEISTAYDGVELERTLAMITDAAFERPVIVDLTEAHSDASHQYDLPFYYNGHIVETNFDIAAATTFRAPLGKDNGYQYLWNVGQAKPSDNLSQVTWILEHSFYSVTTSTPDDTEVIFAEIGANDPDFNLRREPAFILRARTDDGVAFASVIEPHGEYNPTLEFTLGSHSQVASVEVIESGADDYVRIETKAGEVVGVGLSGDADEGTSHSVTVDGQAMTWTGPYQVFHSKKHTDMAQ